MENNNSMVGGSGGQLMDGTSPLNGRADVRCNVKLLSDLIFGILPLETAPFLVAMSAWLSLGRILLLFSMPVCGQSFLIIFGPTYLDANQDKDLIIILTRPSTISCFLNLEPILYTRTKFGYSPKPGPQQTLVQKSIKFRCGDGAMEFHPLQYIHLST